MGDGFVLVSFVFRTSKRLLGHKFYFQTMPGGPFEPRVVLEVFFVLFFKVSRGRLKPDKEFVLQT